MHFALPTPSLDLPCVVPNFTAIPAVTANPHTRYKEAGKLSVHYATSPALVPYSCRVHKEQNDQIQESDAWASVRVSGQKWPCGQYAPCPPYCFLDIGAT